MEGGNAASPSEEEMILVEDGDGSMRIEEENAQGDEDRAASLAGQEVINLLMNQAKDPDLDNNMVVVAGDVDESQQLVSNLVEDSSSLVETTQADVMEPSTSQGLEGCPVLSVDCPEIPGAEIPSNTLNKPLIQLVGEVQHLQAVLLPDGTIGYLQNAPIHTAIKEQEESSITTLSDTTPLPVLKIEPKDDKGEEDATEEAEDGNQEDLAVSKMKGTETLQAIQLDDGTTAYLASSFLTEDGTLQQIQVEGNLISLDQLTQLTSSDSITEQKWPVNSKPRASEQKTNQQTTKSEAGPSLKTSVVSGTEKSGGGMCHKAFKCTYEGCGRLYTTQHHLKVHIRSHTGDRPFRCAYPGCGKAFATGYGLKSHTRIHTGEKPYRCTHNLCTKAFKTSGDLQKHVRTHTGERPFQCPFEGCDSVFTTSNIRKVHIRTHTGERPYVCQEKGCKKSFASATNYKNHIRIHTGEKPYVCTVQGCGKRFTEYSSLYKHHVVHTHSKPYICNTCNKTYRQTSTLAMHKRTAHGEEILESDGVLVFPGAETGEATDGILGKPGQNIPIIVQQDSGEMNSETLVINTDSTQQLSIVPSDSQIQIPSGEGVPIVQHIQGQPLTIAGDNSGQQVYVITDASQIQALQQLTQAGSSQLPQVTVDNLQSVFTPINSTQSSEVTEPQSQSTDSNLKDDSMMSTESDTELSQTEALA